MLAYTAWVQSRDQSNLRMSFLPYMHKLMRHGVAENWAHYHMTKVCTRNNKTHGWSDHRDRSSALINTVTDQRQALPYTRVPAFGQLRPASCSDHAAQSGNLKARCIKYRLNLYFMYIVFKLTELCAW